MTAAIYARYSSELQDARSVEDQCVRMREQMKRDGVPHETAIVFADEATSGSQWDRPGLQALLEAVAKGTVTTIYVESIDRLSRDIGDASRIRKRIEFHGVRLRSIGDGIDLGGGASSLAYDIKSIIGEMYLKDLGDKTLRGLQGRARDGKSTGGRTYGYAADVNGIAIDEAQADVVRRIFAAYAIGQSTATIASMLNADDVDPPHVRSQRGGGWMASCVREMLRNTRYIGDWSFGRRRWRKDPETRRRTPVLRDPSEVVQVERPDLVIVDRRMWDAVQLRHADALSRYGSAVRTLRRPTSYLLSTILVCDCCGAPMEIAGGAHPRYRCARNRKRGTCDNALSARESSVRSTVIEGIRGALSLPDHVEYIRDSIATWLGDGARSAKHEMTERSARAKRTEDRIRGLIMMQAEGDRSSAVAEMRRDLEAQLSLEREAIERLRDESTVIPFVGPAEIARALDVDAILGRDVVGAREQLRGLLAEGQVRMVPRENGRYLARFSVLPLGPIIAPDIAASGSSNAAMSRSGCGGVQPALRTGETPGKTGSWSDVRIDVEREVA